MNLHSFIRMTTRITLRTVLEHIQELKISLEGKATSLERKLDGKMTSLERKVDHMHKNLGSQINAIDGRLDMIEIGIVDQKHEVRIQRLEKRTGIAR
jgi:hypothetical protein